MSWVRKILGLCNHKWVDSHEHVVEACDEYGNILYTKQTYMVQNCSVCNDYRRVVL